MLNNHRVPQQYVWWVTWIQSLTAAFTTAHVGENMAQVAMKENGDLRAAPNPMGCPHGDIMGDIMAM